MHRAYSDRRLYAREQNCLLGSTPQRHDGQMLLVSVILNVENQLNAGLPFDQRLRRGTGRRTRPLGACFKSRLAIGGTPMVPIVS